ncbi:MAG: BA14K family protein [Pseudomonadota bacterium]
MTATAISSKSIALTLAGSLVMGAVAPVASANAHDRHGIGKHRHHTHQHRPRAKQRAHRQDRRNRNGELIAAGVIGLAVGAIIASQARKSRAQPTHQRQYVYDPQPYSNSQYLYEDELYDGYSEPVYRDTRRVPLDSYNNGRSPNSGRGRVSSDIPQVITFNDPGDLQPWTPGWREWCQNRYRSFNPSTGTFRGYDGLDHFCVPK